jgi:hypothetical protein
MTCRHAFIGCSLAAALSIAALPLACAGSCTLQSPPHRLAVLELYTSEGCNSCPPADRWFSALPQRGITADRAVLLAFHVDYWDQLGWPDRFSQMRFSERQRGMAARNRRGVIYTPQLVLDGHDLRAGARPEDLDSKIRSINAEKAGATIRADVRRAAGSVRVTAEIQVLEAGARSESQAWVAVFENGLSSRVSAGENAGKLLYHDFVVRELAGPFPVAADGGAHLDQTIQVAPEWNTEHTGITVFVQRRDSGNVVQAAILPRLCGT